MSLEGKVAIVTGGARGIGKAICEKLAADGAKLAIVDVLMDVAAETAAEFQGKGIEAKAFAANVADPSAVDAMVQRSRARGVIKGESTGQCRFDYVLRKHDVKVGDTVVASGLDGVYPKGLRLGSVSELVKRDAEIFLEITVAPYVDFEKLEEVLVILNPQQHKFTSEP